MSKVGVYLNFNKQTEEAFNYYKSVFGTEFEGGINYMRDVPPQPDTPPLTEEEKDLVMHVSLPIWGDFVLMGTDILESMGQKLVEGNNVFINLLPDTREETDRIFKALSKGGKVDMELQEMFWGDYFGACTDQFGIKWMLNCSEKQSE